MKTNVVMLGTVTYAMKAKKLLSRNGITSKLVKLTSYSADGGCSYGIEFNRDDYYSVIHLLLTYEIPYSLKNEK